VAPKGSEEECGRKSEGLHKGKDLLMGFAYKKPKSRSSDFRSSNMTARIPLQSPIGSEEPIGDSFSPGEAILVRRTTECFT
jgi:hypothetical protein